MKKNLFNKKWLILLAFALGAVVAISVAYLAVTSYMDRNAAPAYYAEMAGKYYTTNVRDAGGNLLSGDDRRFYVELKEDDGRFYTSVQFFQDSDWVVRGPQGGTWTVEGNTLVLEAGYSGIIRLKILEDGSGLLDPRYGRYFRKN